MTWWFLTLIFKFCSAEESVNGAVEEAVNETAESGGEPQI